MKRNQLAAILLASTTLSGLAFAQSATQPAAQADTATAKPAAQRPDTAPMGQTASPTDIGRIRAGNTVTPGGVTRVDLGGGQMIEEDAPKSRSTVTRDAIDKLTPTANPYQMVNLLPGANVSSTDAFGLNGGNITLRGFNSDQIGLTIEGMPVNDSGNYALFPQEYVDAENIQQVSIAQGSPDLDSPHVGATGGVINIYMRDPAKTAGGLVNLSYGTHHGQRVFARVETGQIGRFRAFLSASHYERDHWVAPGRDYRQHLDAKAVVDIGEASRISASFIYNEALNNFYVNPTLAQFKTPGFKPGNLSALPSSYFTGADKSANNAFNYYRYRINPFRNAIFSMPSTFALADDLTLDVIPYVWYGFGSGGGTSTMSEQPLGSSSGSGAFYGNSRLTGIDWTGNGVVTTSNKALFYNPSITETWRPGVVSKLTYQLGNHKLVAGYWFEAANHRQTAPYAALDSTGNVVDPFLESGAFIIPTGVYAGQKLQRRDWQTNTRSNMLFVGDTWTLLDNKLDLDFGVKQVFISRHLHNFIPGAKPLVNTDDSQTLPSIGARLKLTDTHSLFLSLGTSFRVTPNFALADQFSSTSGAKTTAATTGLKPEQSITIEAGHRYQGKEFATSFTAFGTKYSNRQVTTNIIDPTGGSATISTNLNAGSVTTYGVDFEIGTRPINNFRPYLSLEALHSQLNDNLQTTTTAGAFDYLPTKGKVMPRAPQFIGALGLDYDDGHFFGNAAFKYIARQYSTFTNDQAIAPFTRVDTSIGYRFSDYGAAKAPEIKLNIYNLFNTRSLTGVNGVQTNAQTTRGVKGGTIAAASAPTYYMGEGFAAIASLKVGF